jgi:hypothetical protein
MRKKVTKMMSPHSQYCVNDLRAGGLMTVRKYGKKARRIFQRAKYTRLII